MVSLALTFVCGAPEPKFDLFFDAVHCKHVTFSSNSYMKIIFNENVLHLETEKAPTPIQCPENTPADEGYVNFNLTQVDCGDFDFKKYKIQFVKDNDEVISST
eukprot:Pgem_evm1s19143